MKKKLLCIALAFVFTVGLGLTAQAEDLGAARTVVHPDGEGHGADPL